MGYGRAVEGVLYIVGESLFSSKKLHHIIEYQRGALYSSHNPYLRPHTHSPMKPKAKGASEGATHDVTSVTSPKPKRHIL